MPGYSIFFISILTISISVLYSCAHKKTKPDFNKIDDIEMGVQMSNTSSSWDNTDIKIREQFKEDYQNSNDKRIILEKYIDTLGASAMLDFIELTYKHCHSQAHDLGKVIYANSKDIGKALITCGNRCTNACMHGVVSEAFKDKSFDEIKREISTFCSQGEISTLHKPGNCAHGIGHAIMMITNHNIHDSLSACTEFKKSGMDYYCATGVFYGILGNDKTCFKH